MIHTNTSLARVCLAAACLVGFSAQGVPPLAEERVKAIRAYLAAQTCPEPEIDGDNYGNREGVPRGPFYYGWTLDPLPKL